MALRVVEPLPLRTVGIAATVLGVFIVESSAAYRPPALTGLVLLAFGVATLDAVGERRFQPRQLGLFAIIVGGSLAAWAGVVLAVLGIFALPAGGHLWALLWSGAVGTVLGGILIRRWNRAAAAGPRAAGSSLGRPVEAPRREA